MGMYDNFATDPNKEKEGVIIDYGDFRVRIAYAGAGNTSYVKAMEAALRPVRQAVNTGSLSNERSSAIILEVFLDTIILGWQVLDGDEWKSGIESEEGDIIPFNKENLRSTLKKLPNLFADIQQQAQMISNFRKAQLEEEAKN